MKILHNAVEFADIRTFRWRSGGGFLLFAKGINLQTQFEGGKLNIDVAPVYWPAWMVSRTAGQYVLDMYLWSAYCLTVIFQESWPWVQLKWTKEFEYEESDDED